MQTAARGVALSSRGSSSSKRVFTEITNVIFKSNIRRHGKSFAASVPSDSFKPQKSQKRISKQERRAMAESFIDKYRASNAGRFPKASHVRQQIGGSYYTAREIVQELEYKHKASPSNKIEEVRLGKVEKVIYPSSGTKREHSISQVEEILSSTVTAKVRSNMEFIDNIKKDEYHLVKDDETITDLEAKEEYAVLDSVEKSSLEDPISHASIGINPLNEQILEDFGGPNIRNSQLNIEVHVKDVPSRLDEESLQEKDLGPYGGQECMASSNRGTNAQQADVSVSLKSGIAVDTLNSPTGVAEGSEKDTRATGRLQDAHGRGVELIGNQKAPISKELNGDHPRRLEPGESSQQKETSLWGNLKSFADGIINFWKKM